MGRNKATQTPTGELQDVEQDFFDEVLGSFDTENGVEIEGKIYRKTKPEDSIGRTSFEAIAKVSEMVDEDWIGRHFGGGNYFVKWTFRQGERKELRQKNYFVGSEYDKYVKPAAAPVNAQPESAGGFNLNTFLGSLTVEKIAAIGGAVKMLRDFLAPPPPPPQIDVAKLLEIMVANNQKTTPSDAIVTACLTTLQKPQQPQSIVEQVTQFKALKEALKDEYHEHDAEEGGEMNFLLEKALEYLPLLLQKNNNNFAAVGAEASENPMIKGIINSKPELTQKFFEAAREQYGDAAVQQLARGFGYEAQIIPQQQEVNQNEPEAN